MLGWTRLEYAGMDSAGLVHLGSGVWVGLGCDKLSSALPGWAKLGWVGWVGLVCAGLGWLGLA